MAAHASNRSPSPISARPNPNLNSRNHSERETSGIRRSFTGSPLVKVIPHSQQHRSFNLNTPVNSPADYGRRSSFCKESGASRQDFEQKENERDPNSKPVRVRSPSVSKVTKNFMAPTISAASKTLPSPRKKILTERNESVRTSASLSDGKFHFFSLNSPGMEQTEPVWEIDNSLKQEQQQQHHQQMSSSAKTKAFDEPVWEIDHSVQQEQHHQQQVSSSAKIKAFDEKSDEFSARKTEKVVRFASNSIEIEPEPDLVVMSPDLPLHPSKPSESSSPLPETPNLVAVTNADVALDVDIAHSSPPGSVPPLEDDPSLQPYDPMKNYLSPRPQFLHYKPKPRVELYLEENLSSDGSSENESSEVLNLQKDFEDGSSVDMEDDEAEKTQSSEPLASATTVNNVSQGNDESNVAHTNRFITSLKAIALLLVISVVCLPLLVMYLPVMRSTLSRFRTIIPENNLYPVQFYNLTAVDNEENYIIRHAQQYPLPSILDDEVMLAVHDNRPTMEQVAELEVEQKVEKTEENFLPQVDFVSEYSQMHPIDQFSRSISEDMEHIHDNLQTIEQVGELEVVQRVETKENLDFLPQVDFISEYSQVHPIGQFSGSISEDMDHVELVDLEVLESEQTEGRKDLPFDAHDRKPEDNVEIKEQPSQSPEAHSEVIAEESPDETVRTCNNIELNEVEADVSQENHQLSHAVISVPDFLDAPQGIFGVCTAVVCVLVYFALMYKKLKKRSVNAAAAVQVIDKLPAHRSVSKAAIAKMEPSETPVEVDMLGESCPSEMSSFRRCSSSYDNKRGESYTSMNEAESRGKKQRRSYKRESLASSDFSMGSASYGSFTTYSIVHTKQGDDEVVTPIRRSSRIRKQVTSS